MQIILAITTNVDEGIDLIAYSTKEEAIKKMETEYLNLCEKTAYDRDNTYIDKEEGYAQIVEGLKQIEFRVGEL